MTTDRSLLIYAVENNLALFYFERGRWVPMPNIHYSGKTTDQWITELSICPVGIMEFDQDRLQAHLTTDFKHSIGSHDDEWEYYIEMDITAIEMGFKSIMILSNDFTRSEFPVKRVACPNETAAIMFSTAMEEMPIV